MDLVITATGHRCDLALHPVSPRSVEKIQRLGRKFYTKKYLEWWRQGRTCTCGVRLDGAFRLEARLDGQPVALDASAIYHGALLHADRHFIDSPVRHLALLGYEDEYCQTTWTWRNLHPGQADAIEFLTHRWDLLLDARDYLILEDITCDGRCADEEQRGKSQGFNLVDPRVIDLDEVRRALDLPYPHLGGYAKLSRAS